MEKKSINILVTGATGFEVSGDKVQAVHMLPRYTYNIINLSNTANLVVVMCANEIFDPQHPDTFYEKSLNAS